MEYGTKEVKTEYEEHEEDGPDVLDREDEMYDPEEEADFCTGGPVKVGGARGIRKNNRGVATVEIILILVVLVALVVIFRDQIVSLVNTIWRSINGDANTLL